MQSAEHTVRYAMAVAGLHTAEVGAPSCVGKQPSRLPALQRKQSACRLLMASEPPWFLRMMGATSRARWCSWAPQHSQRPWARVSTLYFTEPLIGLLAEGIEAQAAERQQRVALAIAQLVAADQAVVAIAIGGDAVEGEPGAPCASQDPAGDVLHGGGAAAAQQFHGHEWLVDGAHAHAYGHQPRRPSTCSINAWALSHQAVRSRLSSSGSSS